MRVEDSISVSDLHKLFTCDMDAGIIYHNERDRSEFPSDRLCNAWNSRCAGKPAGYVARGYRRCKIGEKKVMAHRIIWAMAHGVWPLADIDHIDRNPLNNSLSNLRDVDHSENQKNMSVRKSNSVGVPGVTWCKQRQRWRASIGLNGKAKSIGIYRDVQDAISARRKAEYDFGYYSATQPVSTIAP